MARNLTCLRLLFTIILIISYWKDHYKTTVISKESDQHN